MLPQEHDADITNVCTPQQQYHLETTMTVSPVPARFTRRGVQAREN